MRATDNVGPIVAGKSKAHIFTINAQKNGTKTLYYMKNMPDKIEIAGRPFELGTHNPFQI